MGYSEIINIVGNYVVIYYHNNRVRYLADRDKCDTNWTYNIKCAKRYIDLSAADIKAGNLRYGMHAVDAQVKYVTKDNKLKNPRRNRYGR